MSSAVSHLGDGHAGSLHAFKSEFKLLMNQVVQPNLPPLAGEMCEQYDRAATESALNALDPCTYNPAICLR